MSVEALTASEAVAHDDVTAPPTTTHAEQSDVSTANGLQHSNGTNANSDPFDTSIEGQGEPMKSAYDDSTQPTINKSDLEPEALRKVFIGGLSYKTDDQAFREYFSKFGDIDVSSRSPERSTCA